MKWQSFFKNHKPTFGALEILKYIGPGLLVTVGFIDPGNWAANIAAGSQYGYTLLWVVTLSTFFLIVLQTNAAQLGIVRGLCLAEAAATYFQPWARIIYLGSALIAVGVTAFAEILGAAIGLSMLFKMPLLVGAVLTAIIVAVMLLNNSYKHLEKYIIGFVSLIGLSFIFELSLMQPQWALVVHGWFVPTIPQGAMPLIMSVLGAVVMPHNLFLHSEIIQSRQWNREKPAVIARQMRYEFLDTLLAMTVGWAINSAMIIVAATVFFNHAVVVTELSQAEATLRPLLGNASAIVFAVAGTDRSSGHFARIRPGDFSVSLSGLVRGSRVITIVASPSSRPFPDRR